MAQSLFNGDGHGRHLVAAVVGTVWVAFALESPMACVWYGLDDGILACLDLATGELKWKDGRYGHGQFILLRDLLLITAENGEVVLLDPVASEQRELTKFQAVNGKTWNPPAMVGDLLLVRNDQEAACYRLPAAP